MGATLPFYILSNTLTYTLSFPSIVRVLTDVGVVVVKISCHFGSKEGREVKGFVHITEFNLCKDKTLIIAMKLVDLHDVLAIRHEVTGLFYASRTAEGKELTRILQRDLLLPFETADTICRRTFDGEIALVTTRTHTHRMTMPTTDIALQNL